MAALAERQADQLNRLVDTFLDVSSVTRGSLPVVLSEVDLTETVQAAIAQVSESLRASRSEWSLETPGPVTGLWDRSRLEQIAANLLSNAIKYGQGKPIRIAVQGDDEAAHLVVQDHGMGISADQQGRIFERFERAVPADHYGGLGLGLYVVKLVAQRLGGSVECLSQLGTGSTFTVTLPRRPLRPSGAQS
jgi:signal transduction histidine kinase